MHFCFSSSSSRFGVFHLLTFSIGFLLPLLMMAPQFGAALKCFVRQQQQGKQLLHAATGMSGLPDHNLNNFTKMRNLTSRNNGGGDNESDEEFTTYCITLKCNGRTIKFAVAVPEDTRTDAGCNQIKQQCTEATGDPSPYCKLCNTDDCNNEEQE